MLVQDFEGPDFGFSYDIKAGAFLLYEKNQKIPVMLKDDDAELFSRHIELINCQSDGNTVERTERAIQIFLSFKNNPCPIPQFIK